MSPSHACITSARVPVLCALLLTSHSDALAANTTEGWSGLSRAYVKARPFLGLSRVGLSDVSNEVSGGVLMGLGAEINTSFGLQIGASLTPFLFTNKRPYPAANLYLGYTTQRLSIGMAVSSSLAWAYPQVGPVVRIGSFSGCYATLQIAWSVYPPLPVPTYLDLDVLLPLGRRLRADLNLGGTYGNSYGAFATLGAQYLLSGDGGRASSALTAGLGLSWRDWSLGPMASLGFERRF